MTLYYATTNKGKFSSMQDAMPRIPLEQLPIELPEPRSDNVEEIAKGKAEYAVLHLPNPFIRPRVIANDAGFSIDALNGWPQAFVNFELEHLGLDGFLKLMDGVEDRSAAFRHALAYTSGTHGNYVTRIFSDQVRGSIAHEPRGERQPWHWSALSQIFIPGVGDRALDCTLAELSREDYKNVRALIGAEPGVSTQFAKWYQNQ